jgi:ADP-ribosyl-[dinitrogen reductase] hydrolase
MDRYWDWYQNGYLSSTGNCFDIGNTVRYALHRYQRTGDPFCGSTSPDMAGNGSLMRLAPIPMYYFPDLQKTLHFAGESSKTTHGAQECMEACRIFAEMLFRALSGMGKDEILLDTTVQIASPSIRDIASGTYRQKGISQIEGTGYVVKSLEAALWCFDQTSTFESAVLKAVNLGDDADTTAAICGQIAGAFYGESNIPVKWLERIHTRVEITNMADQLSRKG